VADANYDKHNTEGELDLYNPDTGTGTMTDEWIKTRATFLTFELLYRATGDTDGSFEMPLGLPVPILGDIQFVDYMTGNADTPYELLVDGVDVGVIPTTQIIFGSTGDDTFLGGDADDSIFGGAGKDNIVGWKGADYIEGNAGDDILSGGDGADRLFGGSGEDRIEGGNDADYIEGGAGNDTLFGDAGSDTIIGGSGNDTLQGDKGDDTLKGGVGYDTYKFNSGDGKDTIEDEDGLGQILYDTVQLSGGTLVANITYKSDDGRFTYILLDQPSGTQNLFIQGPAGSMVVKNFVNENLGLTLAEAPPVIDPNTPLTILGDLAPVDTNPNAPGVQTVKDALGNVITNPGIPEPNRADRLFDSAGNDRIIAGGGDDTINALRGGNDVIEAGTGRDTVQGGDGNDVILGGSESDVLVGGAGDDRIYADVQIDVGTAIDNGNNQTGTGQRGDWLNGGAGVDYILGDVDWAPGNEVTFTTEFGETTTIVYDRNWNVSYFNGGGNILGEQVPFDSGADIIYAGAGADVVLGNLGDDLIYGEGGNDNIQGGEGNDIIFGGEGADIISGDEVNPNALGGGNDYIEGGTGKDTIYSGAGDDHIKGISVPLFVIPARLIERPRQP